MGQISSNINEPSEDITNQLTLNLQVNKPIKQDLKQLLNWSLSEIRQIYAPFRRRKGSPILTRSQFLRFIQLSRITSFFVYDHLAKTEIINVFEIVTILATAAYTNYVYKFQFLFNVFDLDGKKKISFSQLMLFFKSFVRGYCLLTGQAMPSSQLIDQYGHSMFSKADLNNDRHLQIGEIVGWLETSSQCLAFFKNFEPPIYGKQDYHIFNSFVPYSNQEINQMTIRLNKVYNKEKLTQEDYQLLKQVIPKSKKDSTQRKLSAGNNWGTRSLVFRQSSVDKGDKQNDGHYSKSKAFSKNKSLLMETENKSLVFPAIKSMMTKSYKKKFDNIIIIKGKTITKKQVFELRQYFDNLSGGKKHILIEDFTQNFNQEKYNHMKSVSASLFNFLDKHQNGKIEFLDLITKLYPSLSLKHLETIKIWSQEYNKNFNIGKKIRSRDLDEVKKRILPKTCIPRLQQLFRFFDTENKGFVNFENLKQILGNACNEKQLTNIFQNCDTNHDKKLFLKQFVHVLLPSDLDIEGL